MAGQQAWSKAHAKMLLTDNAYNLIYDVRRPKGVPLHVPSTAASIIDHARDQILVSHILTEVEPPGRGAQGEERAGLIKKAADKFTQFLMENPEVALPRQYLHDALLRGACATKIIFAEDWGTPPKQRPSEDSKVYQERKAEWREYRTARFPVVVQPVDPLNLVLPGTIRYPLPWIAEHQQRLAMDMWEEYPDWYDPGRDGKGKDLDPARQVDVWIYCDPDYYILFGDQYPAAARRNPYGWVPYIYSASGMGRRNWTFDPATLTMGLLDKVLSELQAEVRLITAMDALWQYTAWPRLLTTEDPKLLRQRLDVGPAGITYVNNLEKSVKWLESPAPPAQLYALLQRLDSKIENSTITKALSGEAPKGVEFGYLQAILVGQGRLRLGPVLDAQTLFLQWLYGQMLRFQEEIAREPLVISGRPGAQGAVILRPNDIRGHYEVTIKLESADPNENDRRLMVGNQLRGSGAISLRTFLKDFLKKDPEEEISELLAERVITAVMSQPETMATILGMTQAKMQGVGLEELRGQVKERLATGLQVPIPVTPGQPNPQQATAEGELKRLGPLGGAEPFNSRPMGPASEPGVP